MTDYFFRIFKKAEKEYISPKVYFESGCLAKVDGFKTDIKNRLYEEKNRNYTMLLGAAKAGTVKYHELTDEQMNNPKLVKEQKKNLLNYCNDKLSELSETSFSAFLTEITNGRYLGSLSWESI